MRRFTVVSCLLLAVSLVAPFGGHVAHATGTLSTPIESIPVVRRSAVTTLSSSQTATFQGFTLDHGIHFVSDAGLLVLNLGGAYTRLEATIYNTGGCDGQLAFQDASDPAAGLRQLTSILIHPNNEHPINLNVRGVTRLSIVLINLGVCFNGHNMDIVGDFIGSARYVTPTYPSPNTVIPTNTSVVFLWHGFPGASAYLLHIWLVKQSGTTAITSNTRVFLSRLIFGHTSYTWDDRGFLPGIYQYDLLPLDHYGNALAGRNPAIQFTVSQGS